MMTKINTNDMAIPTAKQFLGENGKSLWDQNGMILLYIQRWK